MMKDLTSKLIRLAIAAGVGATSIAAVTATGANAADAKTYCQAVCEEASNAACFERCMGDRIKSKKKKTVYIPPPIPQDEPPVVKSIKQPEWMILVFEPKGGGGNGGGGGGGNR